MTVKRYESKTLVKTKITNYTINSNDMGMHLKRLIRNNHKHDFNTKKVQQIVNIPHS